MNELATHAYDVVVIGGGAAGLSAAVTLARSRRQVLLIDDGSPRNETAAGVHGFLSREGAPPTEILRLGRSELTSYGADVWDAVVTKVRRDGDRFCVETSRGEVGARRVLAATGRRDVLPAIPGLASRWGIDVFHCPYCHGWEVRDQRVGVLVSNGLAGHLALMFRQLTEHVFVLRHTGPAPTAQELEQFAALRIEVRPGEVVEVLASESHLTGVRFRDDSVLPLNALVLAPESRSNVDMLAPLGLRPSELRSGEELCGDHLEAAASGATSVQGVYVAGNVTNAEAQVVSAAAQGFEVGSAINRDLLEEDVRKAVERARQAGADAAVAS